MKVIDSRIGSYLSPGDALPISYVTRRRECLECKDRVTTIELNNNDVLGFRKLASDYNESKLRTTVVSDLRNVLIRMEKILHDITRLPEPKLVQKK